MKKILLICYSFPPNPGIGGRRWAKFTKYLAQQGYEVHVVTNKFSAKKKSEWTSDVQHPNIHVHYANVFYPKVYADGPSNLVGKFMYRFWLSFFKLVSKGSLYDRAFFWKKVISRYVTELIKNQQIKNVVVTAPPFRLLYYSAFLKEKHPGLNLILDFRDPWTDNSSFLGFADLSKKRMSFEKEMEAFSISKADMIVSANDYLTKLFQKRYSKQQGKFLTISNGYDPDESTNAVSEHIQKNNTIRFILTGTLYSDLEYIFMPFITYLGRLAKEKPHLYARLRFDFYGNVDENLKRTVKNRDLKNICFHGFKDISTVRRELLNADYAMLFTAPNHASNFNTKFYEYIAAKKPIIHFSNDGEISEFLIENGIGIGVTPTQIEATLNRLFEQIENNNYHYNNSFDSQKFSVKNLLADYVKLFV